jgi:hypothetical protein
LLLTLPDCTHCDSLTHTTTECGIIGVGGLPRDMVTLYQGLVDDIDAGRTTSHNTVNRNTGSSDSSIAEDEDDDLIMDATPSATGPRKVLPPFTVFLRASPAPAPDKSLTPEALAQIVATETRETAAALLCLRKPSQLSLPPLSPPVSLHFSIDSPPPLVIDEVEPDTPVIREDVTMN